MNNSVTVYDKQGNDWGYLPPDGYDIYIEYRDDKSLSVTAFIQKDKYSGEEDYQIVIAEWSEGSWAHALIQGGEE